MGLFFSMMYIIICLPLVVRRIVKDKRTAIRLKTETAQHTNKRRMFYSQFEDYHKSQLIVRMVVDNRNANEVISRLKDCFAACPELNGLERFYYLNYDMTLFILHAYEGVAPTGLSSHFLSCWRTKCSDGTIVPVKISDSTQETIARYITNQYKRRGGNVTCRRTWNGREWELA